MTRRPSIDEDPRTDGESSAAGACEASAAMSAVGTGKGRREIRDGILHLFSLLCEAGLERFLSVLQVLQ